MPKTQEIVPVGEYEVSTNPHMELITVVGSCIAVTLCDQKMGAGGLVHIVLPGKRGCLRENDSHAFYADSGIPLLIQEVLKTRAKKKNLVAGVFGGATTNPEYGENTIGKRNSEAAVAILRKHGIPLETVDVGGSTERKVTLHIGSGVVATRKRSQQVPGHGTHHKTGLSETNRDDLVRRFETLRPQEVVAGRLLETIHDHGQTVADIQNIVSEDLILASHVFRMINSSYYGFPGRVSSIDDAVRLLGKRRFRLICVVAGTLRQQEGLPEEIRPAARMISRHSYATALIAEQVALLVSPGKKDAAYSTGLLHCTGKLGIALLRLKNGHDPISRNSPACFHGNHGPIGAEILERWNIPVEITDAVRGEKKTFRKVVKDEKLRVILNIACGISQQLGLDSVNGNCVDELSTGVLGQLDLSEQLESIMPVIFSRLNSAGILHKSNRKNGAFTA